MAFHTLINVSQLAELITASNPVILDCSYALSDFSLGRKQYLQHHIPRAYFLDIGYDLSSPVIKGVTGRHPLPDPEVLTSSLIAAGLNNDSQVIVYDQDNGMYAARAWWLLRWLGHEKVALLDGGFKAWQISGHAIDNQWPPPKHGDFTFNLKDEMIIPKETVASEHETIIDSRDYIRYTGESEPIDPIAGHIQGAICIPFKDNTDESGFWKPKDFLAKKFESIDSDNGNPPVFYCGSGVTACHNILAYKIATGLDARLYPGSWSEWINYYPATTGTLP
jgi:thiosulfate/3-mercaptopyruvate sulfurtransferase